MCVNVDCVIMHTEFNPKQPSCKKKGAASKRPL